MLISKFPNLQHTKKSKNRQLLTKPSSWAKLVCLIIIVILISWLNVRPKTQDTRTKNQDAKDGKVAGVATQAPKKSSDISLEQVKPVEPKKLSKLEEMIGKADDLKVVLVAGKKFMDEKRFADAELAFERATELAPDYRDIWYLLAVSYISEYNQNPVIKPTDYSLSKLDRAIFALTRAQVIDPQSQEVKQLLETVRKVKGE